MHTTTYTLVATGLTRADHVQWFTTLRNGYSTLLRRCTVSPHAAPAVELYGPFRSERERLAQRLSTLATMPYTTPTKKRWIDQAMAATWSAHRAELRKLRALERYIAHWLGVAIVGRMILWLQTRTMRHYLTQLAGHRAYCADTIRANKAIRTRALELEPPLYTYCAV